MSSNATPSDLMSHGATCTNTELKHEGMSVIASASKAALPLETSLATSSTRSSVSSKMPKAASAVTELAAANSFTKPIAPLHESSVDKASGDAGGAEQLNKIHGGDRGPSGDKRNDGTRDSDLDRGASSSGTSSKSRSAAQTRGNFGEQRQDTDDFGADAEECRRGYPAKHMNWDFVLKEAAQAVRTYCSIPLLGARS